MKKTIISIFVFFLCLTTSSEIKKGSLAASSIMKIHESSIPPLPEGVVAVEYIENNLENESFQYISGIYNYSGMETSIYALSEIMILDESSIFI